MASITDVSTILGEYMLKGWVLTDKCCPNPGCVVPLLRSPRGTSPEISFCANCDGDPEAPKPIDTQPLKSTEHVSASTSSSTSLISRSSTPATELSNVPGSPTFSLPPETEESRHRREQSDRASSEIGRRLLRGWAMLAEECPNQTCFGVPLVRPPKAGHDLDPRKECVICGIIYTTEVDQMGRERLIPLNARSSTNQISRTHATGALPNIVSTVNSIPAIPVQLPASAQVGQSLIMSPNLPSQSVSVRDQYLSPSHSNSLEVLAQTSEALHSSLQALSARLASLSSSVALDPESISKTADAISRVTQALTHVKQLQWNGNRAQNIVL